MLITEALAEIKTIDKRIAKKHEQVMAVLWRQNQMKDPYAKEGGSEDFVARAMQSINDLHERRIKLRTAINDANKYSMLTVDGKTRTVEEWLIWRREVANAKRTQLAALQRALAQVRAESAKRQVGVVSAIAIAGAEPDSNAVIINIDEPHLARSLEHIEVALGELDGKLSVFNATTTVAIDAADDDLPF